METETPTPEATATVDPPTPTPTYTPTLAYIVETELSDGTAARFEQTVTAGDYTGSVLLILIWLTMVGRWLYDVMNDWRNPDK